MLNLLYEDKAYYTDVVDIFKDEINEQSTNNLQVVLNKNINTLKVFGIKLKKDNNKFKLGSSIYSIDFSLDDLKSLHIIMDFAKSFPDKKIANELNCFIDNLILRMSSDDKIMLDNYTKSYNFSFYYKDLREQIEQCNILCEENFIIDLIYMRNNKEIKCKCVPKEVLYDSKTAYLQVYDTAKNEKFDIPIPDILSISKLPQKASSVEAVTTIVYKLKGRLAKTYKLKENEYSRGFDDDGNQIIVNKGEPVDRLLCRLMKYSYNCEIQAPKILRNTMKNLINDTLKNYE